MGEVALATRTILEYLIVRLRYAKEEQSEGFSMLEGILVVSLDIEDSFQRVYHSHCTTSISAKGDFCYKLLSDQMCREMKNLLPLCQCKALNGRGCPHECIDIMPFQLSFELDEKSGAIKEDCLALKQFIHRISLTHTTVKFHYCVKVNGSISTETYNTERGSATCLPGGRRLLSEGNHFVRSATRDVPSSCNKIHPMTDPSCLTAWESYGYRATLNSDPHWEEDTAKPDVRYKLHSSHPQDSDAQEQTLLLFLFLSYSDQFNDKTVYNFWDRQVILSHLSPILLCSKQAVKGSIQGVVNRILEQHYKVSQEQQKLAQSLPIMADAISSIVSSSTDSQFRRKCLQSLQVADTQKLQVTIKDTFNKVILKQCKCSSACDARRPLPENDEAGVAPLSADLPLPSIHQKLLGSNFSSTELEQRGEGLLHDNSDCGGMSQTRSRELRVDPNVSGEAKSKEKNKSLLAEPGSSSSSFFSHPTKIGCGAFQVKSQEMFSGPSVKKIRSDENLWQDDHFWNQEVSNLVKWTS